MRCCEKCERSQQNEKCLWCGEPTIEVIDKKGGANYADNYQSSSSTDYRQAAESLIIKRLNTEQKEIMILEQNSKNDEKTLDEKRKEKSSLMKGISELEREARKLEEGERLEKTKIDKLRIDEGNLKAEISQFQARLNQLSKKKKHVEERGRLQDLISNKNKVLSEIEKQIISAESAWEGYRSEKDEKQINISQSKIDLSEIKEKIQSIEKKISDRNDKLMQIIQFHQAQSSEQWKSLVELEKDRMKIKKEEVIERIKSETEEKKIEANERIEMMRIQAEVDKKIIELQNNIDRIHLEERGKLSQKHQEQLNKLEEEKQKLEQRAYQLQDTMGKSWGYWTEKTAKNAADGAWNFFAKK